MPACNISLANFEHTCRDMSQTDQIYPEISRFMCKITRFCGLTVDKYAISFYTHIEVRIASDIHVPPIMAKQPKGCDAKLQGLKVNTYRQPATEAGVFLLPLIDNCISALIVSFR